MRMVWQFIFNINGNFILYPTCNMVGIVFKLKIKGHAILKQDREVSAVGHPMSR